MTQSPSRYNTGPPDLSPVGLSCPPHPVPPAQLRSPLWRSPPQARVSRRAPRSARRPQVQCQGQSGHDSQSCRSHGERARTRLSSERSGECGSLFRSFLRSFIRLFRVSVIYRFLDNGERIERIVSYRASIIRPLSPISVSARIWLSSPTMRETNERFMVMSFAAITATFECGRKFRRCLLRYARARDVVCFGNDYYHHDDDDTATTASGHFEYAISECCRLRREGEEFWGFFSLIIG